MDDGLGRDIIDGRIVDWSKMSVEELNKLRKKIKEKEMEIRDKINKELEEN